MTLAVPDGWEQKTGFTAPILSVAVEPETGNSLGLLGFKVANEKFTLNRKEAEVGLMKEAGPEAKIIHRLDAQLVGLPAYCVIVKTELQGSKVTLARIMTEQPLNHYVYAVQFSKFDPGEITQESIPGIADRIRLKTQ